MQNYCTLRTFPSFFLCANYHSEGNNDDDNDDEIGREGSGNISTYLETSSANEVVALPHGDVVRSTFPYDIALLPGMLEGAELKI